MSPSSACPTAPASAFGEAVARAGTPVVDLGSDFRLDPDWAYGLTELFRQDVLDSRQIANPGCYATAATLALAPLAEAGLLDAPVAIDGKSGVSGAGREPTERTHVSEVEGGVQPYTPTGHRHIAEIERSLERLAGEPVPVTFTPHLAPHSRGLEVTCYARLRRPLAQAEADAFFRARYDAEPFVSVEQRVHPGTPARRQQLPRRRLDRRAHADGDLRRGDRQPRQGRGRAGAPERQPRARPRRGRRADGARAGRVSVGDVGVCFPRGFRAAGVTCGIKDSGAPDLALVACDGTATAAGAFTRSRLAAAPVQLSREHLADGRARAVVVNSGNANACTGAQRHGRRPRDGRARPREALGLAPAEVVVCSTGVIGKPLPMDGDRAGHRARRRRALGERRRGRRRRHPHHRRLGQDEHGDVRAERRRRAHRRDGQGRRHDPPRRRDDDRDGDDRRRRRAGGARASCCAGPPTPRSTSSPSTARSRPTTRSSCSRAEPSGVTASGADADALGDALTAALLDVARQMVADGEGASRFAHYTVTGAADDGEARTAVRAIGEDILVRCALHGSDPNWGRMLARAGTCGVALDPERIAVWVGPAQLVAGRRRGRRRARRGRAPRWPSARSRSASTWPPVTGAPSSTRRRSRPST